MPTSCFRFLLIPVILGAPLGCNRAPNAAEPGPFTAQAADAATAGSANFKARMAQLDQSGDYQGMVAAARARLGGDANDVDAHHALALGSFYNGDFALAVAEFETALQSPLYAQDAETLENPRVASFLSQRYTGQKFQPIQQVKSDDEVQTQQWRARGAALIEAKKYDEIEKIAAQQTLDPTVLSDGGWTLAPFYIGLWGGVADSETEEHAQIVAWNAARPDSELARTCLARSWTNGAWTARGGDFADKVAPDAWKIVEERQTKAAPIYGKLLSEKVNSPLVYSAAQRFGRLSGAPREWQDKLFERATTKFPTYTDFYREHSIYLLPRWDGAPGEWEQELEQSADAEAARVDAAAGDRLYARVVWQQCDYYKNIRRDAQIDWPRTKRGFDSMLQQHSNSLSAATIYMRLCYQWGESVKARELLKIVGGRADARAWKTPRNFALTRINILRLLP